MAASKLGTAALVVVYLLSGAVMSLPFLLLDFQPTAGLFQPFQRGFRCEDEHLSYPKKQETVSELEVFLGVLISGLVIIAAVETSVTRHTGRSWPATIWSVFVWFRCYILFGLADQSAASIMKHLVGNHRPYFLTVCQVNASFSCKPGAFVEEDVCTGDPEKIREARLSFPSGHTCLTVYAAVFLILYLRKSVTRRICVVPRAAVQVLLLYGAVFVACSRVMDYAHHQQDVIGGAVLGALAGVAGFMTCMEITATKGPDCNKTSTKDSIRNETTTKGPNCNKTETKGPEEDEDTSM